MPNSCAAYGCNNKFGPDTKQKKITFHLLPLPPDNRRKLWISNSRRIDPITREPWNPSSKYVYFCSEHFMPSDFENPLGKPSNRKLKDNAVPTVFTFPTVPPPSPVKPSGMQVSNSSDKPSPSPAEDTSKTKVLSRSKKTKHRKVVMLPKKIKLLQETSAANVESVTIISFQHLDYDENMQPMFEEAKLDLQYSDESQCEPEEEEYFDDEYTDLQKSIPFEEEELISTFKNTSSENQVMNSEPMDFNNLIFEHDKEAPLGPTSKSEEIASIVSENVDTTRTDEDPENTSKLLSECADTEVNSTRNQPSSRTSSEMESEKKIEKHKKKLSKRKIPVVIKELILIDDIEELRIKAFRIAEDNIKLKRQVIYLEKKLEDLVTQLYTK